MNNRRFAIPVAVGLGMSLAGCDALETKGGSNEDIVGDWSVFEADGREWPYDYNGNEVTGDMTVNGKLKAAMTFVFVSSETYAGNVETIDKNTSYKIPFPTMIDGAGNEGDVFNCDLPDDETMICDDNDGTVYRFERL